MKFEHKPKAYLFKWAIFLAAITVIYNVVEGIVAVYFGADDKTLALFGFGIDSFVEVISGVGIWHMIRRLRQNGDEHQDHFESLALQITGTAFYLLTSVLVTTAIWSIFAGHHPETTLWGVIISSISILLMWWLIREKVKVGTVLNSDAVIADAKCTRACMQLSVVLLIASLGYELTKIGNLDAIGSLLIGGISFREGRESFDKAKEKVCESYNDHGPKNEV
ncbi:MAG: cation transporter [Fidelibacterota bacterium]